MSQKNKELKNFTISTSSRRNISLSVAKKCAFKFAYFILKCNEKTEDYTIKKVIAINDAYRSDIAHHVNIENFKAALHIDYKGTIYKENFYIFFEGMCYKIVYILLNKMDGKIFLYMSKQKSVKKNHYNCYVIELQEQALDAETKIVFVENVGKPFTINTLADGRKCFKVRQI